MFVITVIINIKTPRVRCSEHGVLVVKDNTFGRNSTHFSYKFDALIMQKVTQMSVVSIARDLGETDTTLWRVVNN